MSLRFMRTMAACTLALALVGTACTAGEELIDDVAAELDDLSEEEYCGANPDDADCDEYFDSLTDDEFCQVVPDDEFCAGDDNAEVPAEAEEPLERNDDQCLPEEEAGEDPGGIEFNLAYQVVDGQLGAVCFGSADDVVESAWQVLADLVPPGQLRDLAVFAGFSSTEDPDGDAGVTLAFVQNLDDDGNEFLMAVNIAATQDDPDEATLTMAHEFTHVFTALPSQLDRTISPEDCETFDNGQGCYVDGSIIGEWYDVFWRGAPGDPTDEDDASERCDIDSGFFGNYAASTPEEDFAEAFSAYVLRVPALTDGQQQRLDWIDAQPGLREFLDRAVARGYGPQDHNFDQCG